MVGTALLTAACQKSPPAFTNLDISGNQSFATDFALPDTDGKTRTLADYRGRVVVMVFGYTHCPDVCPATLAELAQALQQLGNDAKQVQVVFVSVDPERDTAPVLAQYVHAFDPSFVALRPADRAQLDAVTKAFKIYYSQNAPEAAKATAGASATAAPGTVVSAPTATSASSAGEAGGYTVDHTAASLVFDTEGKLRLYARDAQGAGPWVHDLKLLVDEKK
ncbi:SCO family protein [Chitinasiproducens palmae]|nr:SCO family protein [Chitinasiproducens palmae]